MNSDIKLAIIEFQKEIEAELDKAIGDLTTELEVADIELLHGRLITDGK